MPQDKEKHREYTKKWKLTHREQVKAEHSHYWLNNTEKRVESKWKIRGIKMDLASYKQLYALQEGKCLICHTFLPKLVVDHNHFTGKVRALLCPNCNSGLGFFRDNPA